MWIVSVGNVCPDACITHKYVCVCIYIYVYKLPEKNPSLTVSYFFCTITWRKVKNGSAPLGYNFKVKIENVKESNTVKRKRLTPKKSQKMFTKI